MSNNSLIIFKGKHIMTHNLTKNYLWIFSIILYCIIQTNSFADNKSDKREKLMSLIAGKPSAIPYVLNELDQKDKVKLLTLITIMNRKFWINEDISIKVVKNMPDWHNDFPEVYLAAIKQISSMIKNKATFKEICLQMDNNEPFCKDVGAELMYGEKDQEIKKTLEMFSDQINPKSQLILKELSSDSDAIAKKNISTKKIVKILQNGSLSQKHFMLLFLQQEEKYAENIDLIKQLDVLAESNKTQSIKLMTNRLLKKFKDKNAKKEKQ